MRYVICKMYKQCFLTEPFILSKFLCDKIFLLYIGRIVIHKIMLFYYFVKFYFQIERLVMKVMPLLVLS